MEAGESVVSVRSKGATETFNNGGALGGSVPGFFSFGRGEAKLGIRGVKDSESSTAITGLARNRSTAGTSTKGTSAGGEGWGSGGATEAGGTTGVRMG